MALSEPSLSVAEIEQICSSGQFNLIPIHQNLLADLETPVSAYLKLTDGGRLKHSFLLESVEGGEREARYSFIGTQPYKVLTQNGVDPLVEIERELAHCKPLMVPELPPFTGGGVGYIGYDCVSYWEKKVPKAKKDTLELPESVFLFTRELVIFDHVKHTLKLVVHIYLPHGKNSDIQFKYDEAIDRLRKMSERLSGPLPSITFANAPLLPRTPELQSNMKQDGYENVVRKLQNHISNGDIIQAVPSHRCKRILNGISAFDVYRSMRIVNPSPYMFFFDLDEFYIVGASPEQLLKVDANHRVTTHPIAGTRGRGKTEEEDLALEKDLLADIKERAEHIMLVDLGRNDVGRVAEPGSVKVDSLMHVERFSHVMHIVSVVSGVIAAGKTPFDAIRSIFPAGTLSGAPKIRAMQLISEFEGDKRGVYGGAIGYISFQGVVDLAIGIRSVVIKNHAAYLQAGGGIVYDSVPLSEWEETIRKMGGVNASILQAERVAAARQASDASH